jgi:hypothetical protein
VPAGSTAQPAPKCATSCALAGLEVSGLPADVKHGAVAAFFRSDTLVERLLRPLGGDPLP